MKKHSVKVIYVCDLCERHEDISNGDKLPSGWLGLVIPPKFKCGQIASGQYLTKHICSACAMGVFEGLSFTGQVWVGAR